MPAKRYYFFLVFLCLSVLLVPAQQTPSLAFASGQFVSSIQMTGTAAWHYGSDEQTGTVTLAATASGQSRIELHLARGTWVETQGPLTDPNRSCSWQGFDGVMYETAAHNCLLGVVWFLPQITLQPGVGTNDGVIAPTPHATNAARLHYERHPSNVANAATAELIARLTSVDIDLDATGLPKVLYFNSHPENDAGIDLPTEVHFGDYRLVEGTHIPFHIQKFVNNALVLDLQISEAHFPPAAGQLQ